MKDIYIVLYDDTLIGGAEKVALNLANEMSSVSNVTVISMFSKNKDSIVELNNRIERVVVSEKTSSLTLNALKFSRKIKSIIKKSNSGSIISITAGLNTIVKLASLNTNVKTLYAEHSNLDNDQYGMKHRFRQMLGAKSFNHIITLTNTDRDRFIEKYSVNPSKVHTIYNWVEKTDEVKNFSYDVNSKTIVSLGRTVKVKGYDRAVRIGHRIFSLYPDWKWEIYGDGDEFDNLQNQINSLGIKDNMILKGFSMDLAEALSKKSIFVSTSTYEGFPLSFLEARDFGLPIVSFDCPTGPKEIIDDGVTGVLIKPYDEDKMLEKIIELIEDDEKRVEMSNNTLLSLNKFSKESSMKDWKELLLND